MRPDLAGINLEAAPFHMSADAVERTKAEIQEIHRREPGNTLAARSRQAMDELRTLWAGGTRPLAALPAAASSDMSGATADALPLPEGLPGAGEASVSEGSPAPAAGPALQPAMQVADQRRRKRSRTDAQRQDGSEVSEAAVAALAPATTKRRKSILKPLPAWGRQRRRTGCDGWVRCATSCTALRSVALSHACLFPLLLCWPSRCLHAAIA